MGDFTSRKSLNQQKLLVVNDCQEVLGGQGWTDGMSVPQPTDGVMYFLDIRNK